MDTESYLDAAAAATMDRYAAPVGMVSTYLQDNGIPHLFDLKHTGGNVFVPTWHITERHRIIATEESGSGLYEDADSVYFELLTEVVKDGQVVGDDTILAFELPISESGLYEDVLAAFIAATKRHADTYFYGNPDSDLALSERAARFVDVPDELSGNIPPIGTFVQYSVYPMVYKGWAIVVSEDLLISIGHTAVEMAADGMSLRCDVEMMHGIDAVETTAIA